MSLFTISVPEFDQKDFNEFILRNHIINFSNEPFVLSSGRHYHWYVNWRNPCNDVALIDELSDHVIDFINMHKLNPDTIYGVPEGATKLAIITQYKWACASECKVGYFCLSMGRGKPKEHGASEDWHFIGLPKGRTVVIEDVTTTGNSLMGTIDQLRQHKVNVIAAMSLTQRNERRDDGSTVEEVFKRENVPYYAMSNAVDLLPEAVRRYNPEKELRSIIEQEFMQDFSIPLKEYS